MVGRFPTDTEAGVLCILQFVPVWLKASELKDQIDSNLLAKISSLREELSYILIKVLTLSI